MHGTKAKENGSHEYNSSLTCQVAHFQKTVFKKKKEAPNPPPKIKICAETSWKTSCITTSRTAVCFINSKVSSHCDPKAVITALSRNRLQTALLRLHSLGIFAHGEMLRLTQRNTTKTQQHMYQELHVVISGEKKTCVFFLSFLIHKLFGVKCLEDPKLSPMLPSPPQHDRQRCPVPAAATATAPTRIDSSSQDSIAATLPLKLKESGVRRLDGICAWIILRVDLPSPILVSKQSNISISSFSIHHSKRTGSMGVLEPSPTNSNQAVQQMKCFWPSPPLLTHADAAVERHHGRLQDAQIFYSSQDLQRGNVNVHPVNEVLMGLVMIKTNKTLAIVLKKRVKNLDLHGLSRQDLNKKNTTSCHLSRFHIIHIICHLPPPPKQKAQTHPNRIHLSQSSLASKAKFHFKPFPVEVIQALKATTFPRWKMPTRAWGFSVQIYDTVDGRKKSGKKSVDIEIIPCFIGFHM